LLPRVNRLKTTASNRSWQGKSNVRFVVLSRSAKELDGRTDGLRRRLLPARRRGESDQGAEVFVRGKLAVRANASEPNPAVPMFVRLRVVHAAAAVRAGGNGNVASSMPHVRERLFKIGGLVRVTTRRVWAHFSSSYPDRELFAQVSANLRRHAFFPM